MTRLIILMLLVLSGTSIFAQKGGQSKNKGSKQTEKGIYACPMHPDMVSNEPGVCSKCDTKLTLRRVGSKALEHTSYSCVMHPEVISNKPGTCNKCNKKLELQRTGSKQTSAVSFTCPNHLAVVTSPINA
jgi:hypothetical protein